MNTVAIQYRRAVPGDAAAMVDVHYAAVQGIDPVIYTRDILLAWSPSPDAARVAWLADQIGQASCLSYVAESSGETVLGFYLASTETGQLKALYVHPQAARLGVGRALLQHVEERFEALQLPRLQLNASYNAERFYRGNGYESLGSATQALGGGVTMGAIHMSRNLTQKRN